MLKPLTATFPCGYFSRKNRAAVAFQNLHASISQHPWFTPRNTHIHPLPFLSFPPSFLHFHVSSFLSLLSFFSLSSLHFFSYTRSIHVCFALHPSLLDRVYSPRATSARLSATDLLIGFSLSAVNTPLVLGVVSQTLIDLYLTLGSHWLGHRGMSVGLKDDFTSD